MMGMQHEKALVMMTHVKTEKLKALSVKDGEDFQDYAYIFIHITDRMKLLYNKRLEEKEYTPSIMEPSNYSTKEFLDKIRI
jgi:hypothetical protein